MTTASKPGARAGELLAEALAHHRAGSLAEAERGYRTVLEIDGNNLHALTLHPLFDTARFTRHLEAAYARMWDRHRGGEPPSTFRIAALDQP